MPYLDPKSDIAFKKIFGDQRHADITISFLNAVLERTGRNAITSITIADPINHPENTEHKTSVVDVRCVDGRGRHLIVEMQVVDKGNFAERTQYYTALALAHQLSAGEDYKLIKPVIFVGVLNFEVEPSMDYLNHHYITNAKTGERVLKHMEFHFLEVAKFNKSKEELVNPVDEWAFTLKEASKITEIPKKLSANKQIREAFNLLEQCNWTTQELEAHRRYMEAVHAERDLKRAGFEEGLVEGVEKGKAEGKAEVAKQMLIKGIELKVVQEVTGLSAEEIAKLK